MVKEKEKPGKFCLKIPKKGKDAFKILGNEVDPTEELYEILVEYVCAERYMTCVNEVRYSMFRLGSFSDECLPPNTRLPREARPTRQLKSVYLKTMFSCFDCGTKSSEKWLGTERCETIN
jgi:hypothetical protein